MQFALQEAGLNTDQIDYINVHGTSTPLGDVAETKAIQAVFGDHAYGINISSTKSMTGLLLVADGAIEAIASIMSLNPNFIPPTITHFEDDPEIDDRLNFTFNEAQQRSVKAVMSNGFGFGGHNTSLIFGHV
jgi:3-oxoacyl-[acyl-carrier-protein] synthase II